MEIDDLMRQQLDDAAQELLDEFEKHLKIKQERHPKLSQSTIFEAWSLQRFSNLQFAIMQIVKQMEHLERRIKEREKHDRT